MKKIISTVIVIALLLMTFPAFGAGVATITVDNVALNSAEIKKGNKTVEVKISISNNPGIIGAILSLTYESSYFELINVDTSNGALSKASFDSKVISKASPAKSPYVLAWAGDTLPKNIKDNGVIATLKFNVNKDTPDGVYPVELSYDYENYGIVNYNIQSVKFEIANGSITVGEDAVAATPVPTINGTPTPTEKPTAVPSGDEEPIIDEYSDDYYYIEDEKAPKIENLCIAGASLDIKKGLDVKFKVSKSLFNEENGYSEPYLLCSFGGKKTKIADFEESGNYYVFLFTGVTAEKLGEPINATVYGTLDGVEYCGNTIKYCIKDYCFDILKKHSDDTKLCTLVVDILNFGAAAQKYSGFDTDNLVNAELTDEQKQFASTNIPSVTSILDTEVNIIENQNSPIIGAGIVLKDKVYLRYLIKTDNPNGLCANISFNGSELKIDTITKCSSGYYVYVPIDLTDILSEMTINISYKGETESNTVKYSVASYISEMKNTSAELDEVLDSLLRYYTSATEYVK